jgi:hypothetical protein
MYSRTIQYNNYLRYFKFKTKILILIFDLAKDPQVSIKESLQLPRENKTNSRVLLLNNENES